MRSADFYRSMLNEFDITDLRECNNDDIQHTINRYCYLRDLYNALQKEFDIMKDDIETIDYIHRELCETVSKMHFQHHKMIAIS